MAAESFPIWRQNKTTFDTAIDTSKTISSPDVRNKDDLWLGIIRVPEAAGSITWPSPWVELDEQDADGSNDRQSLAYMFATGSEASTFDITIGITARATAIVVRIEGGGIPEKSFSGSAGLSQPDPPNHSPGSARPYLWVIMGGNEDNRTISSPSANYTNEASINMSGTASGAQASTCWTASRQLVASSENPGQFTLNNVTAWMCWTVSVPPANAPRNPAVNFGTFAHLMREVSERWHRRRSGIYVPDLLRLWVPT